jgi:hypothetical protein
MTSHLAEQLDIEQQDTKIFKPLLKYEKYEAKISCS